MRSSLLRRSAAGLAAIALWATLAPATGPASAATTDAADGWSPPTPIATERDRQDLTYPGFAVNDSGEAVVAWRCSRPEGLALCARTRAADGSWGGTQQVAEPEELIARETPRVVLDESGVGTLVWVRPSGEVVARRVLPDGSAGDTYAIASGLSRRGAAMVMGSAADGSLLLTWFMPGESDGGDEGDPVRVLAADGTLSPVQELTAGSLGRTVATSTGWAMLSLDESSHRYRLTRIAEDGTASAQVLIGAAGRGRVVGYKTADLVVGPDDELTAVWLRPRQGLLLTRAVPAGGQPGPVTRVAEGLESPRWLNAGRTSSGRMLVTFSQTTGRGDAVFGLRLPTAADPGSAPARIGRLFLPLVGVAGDVMHFVGLRGVESTVAAWTWDGDGRLSAPRDLMASPYGDRAQGYGVGITTSGSTLGVLGYWSRSLRNGQQATRVAVALWHSAEAPAGSATPESSHRIVSGGPR